MRQFETGATRNVDENKYDYEGFLSPIALKAFAEYMHNNRVQADGKLRDSDNWQKGIPLDSYMKSMYRHFFSVWENHRGIKSDEDIITSLCALMFNVQGYLHEYLKDNNLSEKDIYINRVINHALLTTGEKNDMIDILNSPIKNDETINTVKTMIEHRNIMMGIDNANDNGDGYVWTTSRVKTGDWGAEPITRPKTLGERYDLR